MLLKESFGIFRRNPLTSTFIVLLIFAASLGQVISLSSLYPILENFLSDKEQNVAASTSPFAVFLEKVGLAPTFTYLLLLFIVLGIAYSVLNWCADSFQNFHLKNFEIALRRELFEAAAKANWTYLRSLRHGEFISVLTRESGEYRLVIKFLLYTFTASAQFVALLAYAAYLNWKLTTLGVAMFAVGAVALLPVVRRTNEVGTKSVKFATNMSNAVVNALRSLKMVKALSLESFLVRTVQPSFELSASNYFRGNLLISGQYAMTEIIGVVAISSMMYVGLYILSVPKPQLLVILVFLFRALPQARLAIDNCHRAYAAIPSIRIVREHIANAAAAKSRQDGLAAPQAWQEITFDAVSFQYEDGRRLIQNLSFVIRRGEFWAVVGPSGIGKTTFLDILLGLLDPSDGAVQIDSIPLKKVALPSWHAQIAYLGQEPFAFAGTLKDNLVWGAERHFTESQLLHALRAAKLTEIGTSGSEILSREITEGGSNLSGGEKQRLALARLFLRQPALVILDEPTAGLDMSTERDIFDSITTLFTNSTLIMVTHREELTDKADHLVRFTAEGLRVYAGKELRKRSVVFQKP